MGLSIWVDVHIGGVVGFTVIDVWVCRYEGVQCGCSECGRLHLV